MQDNYLYAGLIRRHILHHAAKEPIYGLAMIEELERLAIKSALARCTLSCMDSKRKAV